MKNDSLKAKLINRNKEVTSLRDYAERWNFRLGQWCILDGANKTDGFLVRARRKTQGKAFALPDFATLRIARKIHAAHGASYAERP